MQRDHQPLPVSIADQEIPLTSKDLQRLAKGRTEAALRTLEQIMLDPGAPASARAAAATALLDRGWGKPTQTTETRSVDLTALHLDALQQHLREARAERLTLEGQAVEAPENAGDGVVGYSIGVNPWLSR